MRQVVPGEPGRHARGSRSWWRWLDAPIIGAVFLASAVFTGADAVVSMVQSRLSDGQATVTVSIVPFPVWLDAYIDAARRAGEAVDRFGATLRGD